MPSFSFAGAAANNTTASTAPQTLTAATSTPLSFAAVNNTTASSAPQTLTATTSAPFCFAGAAATNTATSTAPQTLTTSISTPSLSLSGNAAIPAPAATAAGAAAATSTGNSGGTDTAANAEYRALDVRSIIQLWHKELAEDAEKFQEQAQRVSIWDNQLRENQRSLEDIVEGVHKLMATQQDLKSSIDSIEAYQNDLETELSNLSEDLDLEIEKMQLQEPTDDDLERERSYLLAEDLNHSLNQMESSIKKIVTDLNMKSDTSAGDASHPVAKVSIS